MIPTPEQARELLEHFGAQHRAATACGVSRWTFRYWLDPDAEKARRAAHYAANGEATRARMRAYYDALDGVAYNRKLLLMRRRKALKRMEGRNQAAA